MMIKNFKIAFGFLLLASISKSHAQNPLNIPPALYGPIFNLTVREGTTTFFPGYNTATYGVNGALLGPTLFFNRGDSITLNVINTLPFGTTMHWHGLHIPARWDGGPHQIIPANTTWSPRIKVMNDAATYWYHPHGENRTELQVTKGLAGMIIIRDPTEAALTLPRTYGVDDFPLVVQTKAFDILRQVAIATHDDTAIMVNGTMHPYLNVPAQVVRLRFLNGSTMRTYMFGLSNNQSFKLIGTDDGLLDSAVTLTRIRLSPGERAEVLVNFSGMMSQTLQLKSYCSELKSGIYGADTVGHGASILPGYDLNPLNGSDFNVLQLNVVAPTSSPVTTMPNALIPYAPYLESAAARTRTISFDTQLPIDSGKLTEGPFTFNDRSFNMMEVADTVHLNDIEIWKLINTTLIAHPFHIHDISFDVLDINGKKPSAFDRGKKDVVLVMPGDTVRFITKFGDFADATVPYMYHCHLLHHEDDGMMASFIVVAGNTAVPSVGTANGQVLIFPNPAHNNVNIRIADWKGGEQAMLVITDFLGRKVYETTIASGQVSIPTEGFASGLYQVSVSNNRFHSVSKLLIK